MTSPDLDDLRHTLRAHADDALGPVDRGLSSRAAAVHARARRTRRRRTAAAGALAALALGAGVGLRVLVPEATSVDPAQGPQGSDVLTATTEMLGFPYRLTDQLPITADGLDLGPTDTERAVRVRGTDLGEGSITLFRDDVAVAQVSAEHPVSVPVPVPVEGASLRVVSDGVPAGAGSALAVYERSGLAEGVVGPSDQVLRSEREGSSLVAGVWADVPRPTSVALTLARPVRNPELWMYCSAPTPGVAVSVEYTGGAALLGDCDDTGPEAGHHLYVPTTAGGRPSLRGTVQVILTRGDGGPHLTPAEAEGVVLGLGVYTGPPPEQRAIDVGLPPVIEFEGRSWQLGSLRNLRDDVPPTYVLRATNGSGSPGGDDRVLLGVVRDGAVLTSWDGPVADGSAPEFGQPGSTVSQPLGLLVGGDDYQVTATIDAGAGGPDGTSRAAIATYYPALDPPE